MKNQDLVPWEWLEGFTKEQGRVIEGQEGGGVGCAVQRGGRLGKAGSGGRGKEGVWIWGGGGAAS